MPENLTSILAPFNNRAHAPDLQVADFLFQVYELLLNAPPSMSPHAKKRTFENAADGAHSWPVVCVSEDALKQLLANKGDARGLRRAHAVSREVRYQSIFGADAKRWTKEELVRFFFEHDICALVTFNENKTDTVDGWSDLYAVPELLEGRKGMMHRPFPGSFSVYARKTVELPWAQKLWADIEAGRVVGYKAR